MRVGIIGCGQIARSHAAAFKENGVQCVGVVDNNAAAAEKFAAELGNARTCNDDRELICSIKPELISICTPPLAPDLKTAQKLFAWAEKSKTPLFSSSALRFAREIAEIKAAQELSSKPATGP